MQSRRTAAALGRWGVAFLLVLLVGGELRAAPASSAAPAPSAAPSGRAASVAPARLVVALVFDQLGSDTLLRHLSWLDPGGAIAQAIARGVFLERSVYPYASTLTAPGHAAIHTGAAPNTSGIDNNSRWDEAQGRALGIVDEPGQLVFGRERDGVTVGPGQLRVPTVAAQLKAETRGAGRVVSLSLKDRSAVLSVGAAADLVLWFDSKLGAFTSSPVWGPALPAWVGRYQAAHPLRALLTPWLPLSRERYAALLGPDAAPGEGDYYGLGTTFPHGWERVSKSWSALGCTPMLSEYLVGLADAAVTEQGLGLDDVPDLLALSISGTDCAGHVFGPDSWEYVDHLVRADRAAGQWLTRLAKRLPLSVVITSDHGVARLPERAPAPSGRISSSPFERQIEAALVQKFGAGPWLSGGLTPFVYLSARARQHPRAGELLETALAVLRAQPGVREAWPVREVRGWEHAADPWRRALALGVAPGNGADLLYVPLANYPYELGEPLGKGTNHGSPYAYDREVVVLAWGKGVPRLRSSEPVDQLRVAATLARLLGIAAPAQAVPQPLF